MPVPERRYTYLIVDETGVPLAAHSTLSSAIDHFYLVVEHRLNMGWTRAWTQGAEPETDVTRFQKRTMLETYVKHPEDSRGLFHNGTIRVVRMTMRNQRRTESAQFRLRAHGIIGVIDAEFEESDG